MPAVDRTRAKGPRLARLTGVSATAALLAGSALALLSPGSARPEPAAVQVLSSHVSIAEGPGGRTQLTRWTLRRDPSNRGLSRGWQRGGFSGSVVGVPNVVDPTQFEGEIGARNYEGSVAWYRTSFQAPSAGTYAFTFQSANFRASVWIDGHALGSHEGSYLPFEVRAQLTPGKHTLVVRVDWRNPNAQSKAGFHRTWFNWGGLDGEVDMREVGLSELSSPTIETTLTPDEPTAKLATVKLGVQVRNDGPARTITPEGTLVHGTQTIALSFPALALAHGQSALATTTVSVEAPALWSPTSPSLYQLTLAVGQESSYSARVGLRELTWHGGRMYLNGQRLQLHGATIQEDALGHGDALTPNDESEIVRELKAIGANAARAQHPLDPGLLERLDAAGIVVWQGVGPVEGAGNWYSSTPRLLADAEQQARSGVIASQLHPSIIAWNLVDEVAGNGHDAAEVRYVQTLTAWLHARDRTRMVAVDVWGDHPPRHAGSLYANVDAIAETDYTGWYDHPDASPARQSSEMRARLAAMQRTFAGRVLVISEFGAESNALNPSGSPGSYSFQSRLLARHIAVYEGDAQLSGMLIWVLRDYPLEPMFEGGSIHTVLPHLRLIEGLNQKGLFTYGQVAKPAVAVVAHLFKALPAG
ncbi:MAG TPA: glycoside hydrolase family 2 TIM barrel-domain containing protein [Solirubrobacteraceae bacterium]|nr:glycoside hydrolase family 2 TIM barrel-domain containing protein [Solirubrobacteraceae bacterium]